MPCSVTLPLVPSKVSVSSPMAQKHPWSLKISSESLCYWKGDQVFHVCVIIAMFVCTYSWHLIFCFLIAMLCCFLLLLKQITTNLAGLTARHAYYLTVLCVRSLNGSCGLKSKCCQSCIFFWGLEERTSFPCLSQLLEAICIPWRRGLPPLLKGITSSSVLLVTPLSLWPSCLPLSLVRTLVITLDALRQPRIVPPSPTPYYNHTCASPFHHVGWHSHRFWELGRGGLW